MNTDNPRELRGLAILAMGNQVKRIDSSTYHVRSQSGNGLYSVARKGLEWTCECPDFIYRHAVCKHIHAVQFSLNLRQRVTSENLGFENVCTEGAHACKYCGSTNVIKRGFRKKKGCRVQRFSCRGCGKRFILEEAFERIKSTPKIITIALDLFFKGCSYRKIVDHLKQFYGVKVTHVAIIKWVKKYTELMKHYVDGLTPNVSGVWHTDEMAVNVKGQFLWLWNLIDHDTRFLLASQISAKREIDDARRVFSEAKALAKVKPAFVVTDGLRAYEDAFKKEFFTLRNPRTEHVRLAGLAKASNNNLVERLHGTVRERDKTMRGLKKEESDILKGLRIYYNFIRPHMALNGKTPAEVANINLQLGQNRWEDLIRKSKRAEKE
jgi:putative transposase